MARRLSTGLYTNLTVNSWQRLEAWSRVVDRRRAKTRVGGWGKGRMARKYIDQGVETDLAQATDDERAEFEQELRKLQLTNEIGMGSPPNERKEDAGS